jgi:membrane protease YdiL (CAAX protease family)
MKFNFRNLCHLFAGSLVFLSFCIFIGIPIISVFFHIGDVQTINQIADLEGSFGILFEILLLGIQLIVVIFLFILVPVIWYKLVDTYSIKKILTSLQLKKEHLDVAFLWGVITAIIALGIVLVIGIGLRVTGISEENASNIQDLELFFSLPTILILITFQPIAEEIFFRGFLIDKFKRRIGKNPSILLTSLLFGAAHISMGNILPALIISMVALVFGYMVVKTKNLMTGIIAHILFNIISFLLYMIGKEIINQALIL